MSIKAVIPIIMPNSVRNDRSLWAVIDEIASFNVSEKFILSQLYVLTDKNVIRHL